MAKVSKGKVLRQLLEREKILVAPGAYNALVARLIEQAGFEAILHTGFGTAATLLGMPDVGLVTMVETATQLRNMAAATSLPIIADGDNGYGDAINVMRTIREVERAGAAGIYIEDQLVVQCSTMGGTSLVPTDDMVDKVKAAVEARESEDFVIIARTDAAGTLGIEEAIARANAYVSAGADAILIPQPLTAEEMKKVAGAIDVPFCALSTAMRTGDKRYLLEVEDFQSAGVAMVADPAAALFAATKGIIGVLDELKSRGSIQGYLDKMLAMEDFGPLVGVPEMRALQQRYCSWHRGGR